jgi:hypothetical protein
MPLLQLTAAAGMRHSSPGRHPLQLILLTHFVPLCYCSPIMVPGHTSKLPLPQPCVLRAVMHL